MRDLFRLGLRRKSASQVENGAEFLNPLIERAVHPHGMLVGPRRIQGGGGNLQEGKQQLLLLLGDLAHGGSDGENSGSPSGGADGQDPLKLSQDRAGFRKDVARDESGDSAGEV